MSPFVTSAKKKKKKKKKQQKKQYIKIDTKRPLVSLKPLVSLEWKTLSN